MKGQNLLEKYDIRDTQPRRELVNIISSFGRRHFSVEDILRKGKVSRATTFRAVNLFSQKGLLHSIDLGKGFKLYELALDSGHHDHLYCIKCGRIIEFEDKNIENLQAKACQEKNFKPIKHTLRITGLCKGCR
jgi:Fur family ferric uptake transcriptional regulator